MLQANYPLATTGSQLNLKPQTPNQKLLPWTPHQWHKMEGNGAETEGKWGEIGKNGGRMEDGWGGSTTDRYECLQQFPTS